MNKSVEIPEHITVSDLAQKLEIDVTELITELMKNGIMATLNDKIDFDTAQIIVAELGSEIELTKKTVDIETFRKNSTRKISKPKPRPPVIAVMGHVDHGKTTLLDAIRGAEVVKGEAGGITQYISAYQIRHNDRDITFLDTPGHEAFASLRQHGAHLTDLVILVVAADDGVKPQTKEAIKFAQQAGVKIMVAINKTDKSAANINLVLQELNDSGLVPEQWGGDTVVVEVSALKKTGLNKLLDMALLITDVEELVADASGKAEGIVIESHMETGRGAVVTLLVEHGQLQVGDYIAAGQTFGKIRTLEDYTGAKLDVAMPSTPAFISGLKELPSFGVEFKEYDSEKDARKNALLYKGIVGDSESLATTGSELLAQIHKDRSSQILTAVVKADVRGSVTSVVEGLQSLGNDEISVQVVGSGAGAITENDVMLASITGAIIYGFNVSMATNIKRLASTEKVQVRLFKVIYELMDDATEELQKLLIPEVIETNVGRLLVKGIFKTTQHEIICGGEVTKGVVKVDSVARIYRDEKELGEGSVTSVQRGQQEVKEALKAEMCGLRLKTEAKINLKEGDRLEFFTSETLTRKL
jgi:translation initiation factor IF-2